jgi:glycosyltransferase involved in cell wall biosynthesis
MALLSRRWLRARIHADARRLLGSDRYVQIFYHPYDRLLTDPRAGAAVYEVVDRFAAYPVFARQTRAIERHHRRAAAQAARVCATTAELAALPEAAGRVTVIPNGVDLAHYRRERNAEEPADLRAVPHPRAVYIGALHEWFDFDLLAAVARLTPQVSYVVIGFGDQPPPPLPANVHLLGARPWTALAAYLWHCDAGIVPFRINDLTRHVDPLKFYEYMGCDLPCVSTPMYALEAHRAEGVLALAGTPAEFAGALTRALDPAARAAAAGRRAAIAEAHAWPVLARCFEAELLAASNA